MKVLFVLCEGSHDAQFLGRLLVESNHFSEYTEQLWEYPSPLGDFIKNQFEDKSLDEIRLGRPNERMVPTCAFKKTGLDGLVVIVPAGGRDPGEDTIDLLWQILDNFSEDTLGVEEHQVKEMAILFLQDANSRGVEATRADFISQYLKALHAEPHALPDFPVCAWQSVQILIGESTQPFKVALFVLTDEGGNTGTLEDILLSLFRERSGELVQHSQAFMDGHFEQMGPKGDQISHVAKKNKALLTCCAQVEKQNAGYSLAVGIKQTRLLTGAFDFDRAEAQWSRLLTLVNDAFME